MRQVSKEQFFDKISRLSKQGVNIHPTICSGYPFKQEWKVVHIGQLIGVTEDYLPESSALHQTRYFLV